LSFRNTGVTAQLVTFSSKTEGDPMGNQENKEPESYFDRKYVIPPRMVETVLRFERHYEAAKGAPVMIVGSSGVGKTMFIDIYKILYSEKDKKQNAHKPIVTINCAHYDKDLARSELFGYVKGAFTGAERNTEGLIQEADGGLLILEEIGNLPEGTQEKLLTFIETGEYYQVGGRKPIRANVQVLGATNDDSKLRPDFKYRFFRFYIPPLYERRGDILYYLDSKYPDLVLQLLRNEILALMTFNWEGNVRQIETIGKLLLREADTREDVRLEPVPTPFEARLDAIQGFIGEKSPSVSRVTRLFSELSELKVDALRLSSKPKSPSSESQFEKDSRFRKLQDGSIIIDRILRHFGMGLSNRDEKSDLVFPTESLNALLRYEHFKKRIQLEFDLHTKKKSIPSPSSFSMELFNSLKPHIDNLMRKGILSPDYGSADSDMDTAEKSFILGKATVEINNARFQQDKITQFRFVDRHIKPVCAFNISFIRRYVGIFEEINKGLDVYSALFFQNHRDNKDLLDVREGSALAPEMLEKVHSAFILDRYGPDNSWHFDLRVFMSLNSIKKFNTDDDIYKRIIKTNAQVKEGSETITIIPKLPVSVLKRALFEFLSGLRLPKNVEIPLHCLDQRAFFSGLARKHPSNKFLNSIATFSIFGSGEDSESADFLSMKPEDFKRFRIVEALKQTKGNRAEAARRLGIAVPTIYNQIKSLKIDVKNLEASKPVSKRAAGKATKK
jgi:transcriptional regulator with AAA-type ATPase domain